MSDDLTIHSPEWWAEEDAAVTGRLKEFSYLNPDDIDVQTAFRIGTVALAEFVTLYEVVKALALENQPKPPGRPCQPIQPKPPKGSTIQIRAVDGQIEYLGQLFTPERAREIGTLLVNAANEALGGAQDE